MIVFRAEHTNIFFYFIGFWVPTIRQLLVAITYQHSKFSFFHSTLLYTLQITITFTVSTTLKCKVTYLSNSTFKFKPHVVAIITPSLPYHIQVDCQQQQMIWVAPPVDRSYINAIKYAYKHTYQVHIHIYKYIQAQLLDDQYQNAIPRHNSWSDVTSYLGVHIIWMEVVIVGDLCVGINVMLCKESDSIHSIDIPAK